MSNQFCPKTGKIMHPTAAGAYRRVPKRGGKRTPGKAYRCKMCHSWHTTSSV